MSGEELPASFALSGEAPFPIPCTRVGTADLHTWQISKGKDTQAEGEAGAE